MREMERPRSHRIGQPRARSHASWACNPRSPSLTVAAPNVRRRAGLQRRLVPDLSFVERALGAPKGCRSLGTSAGSGGVWNLRCILGNERVHHRQRRCGLCRRTDLENALNRASARHPPRRGVGLLGPPRDPDPIAHASNSPGTTADSSLCRSMNAAPGQGESASPGDVTCYRCAPSRPSSGETRRKVRALSVSTSALKIPVSVVRFRPYALFLARTEGPTRAKARWASLSSGSTGRAE